MAPKAESKNTSSYILFDQSYAFGLSRNNFFLSQTTGKWGGGGLFQTMSPSAPPPAPRQFDWTKLAYFTSRSCIQQNKTSIKPLRHTLRIVFRQSPLVGPQGSGLDQNCTCTTRPWGQQNVTINRSLQYLITEEIKEQDIVYVQTDGRPDDERVSHKLDWSSTSRAKNCIHSNSTLILQKAHIFAFSCPPSKTVCVKS